MEKNVFFLNLCFTIMVFLKTFRGTIQNFLFLILIYLIFTFEVKHNLTFLMDLLTAFRDRCLCKPVPLCAALTRALTSQRKDGLNRILASHKINETIVHCSLHEPTMLFHFKNSAKSD